MQIDHSVGRGSVEASSIAEGDPSAIGIVVLDREGRVHSANDRSSQLLGADSTAVIRDRLRPVTSELQAPAGAPTARELEVSGLDRVLVRSYAVGDGRVLLLQPAAAAWGTNRALEHASRHRAFAFLARDWAHDLKGMLHVIRINSALLTRLLQRDASTPDAAVTRCLDAIPREVEQLDRAIELIFDAGSSESTRTFDVASTLQRVLHLVRTRATRQRVEIVFEKEGATEITGLEDQVRCAILNVVINALEAMPEQGRLSAVVCGRESSVTIRVCDNGPGAQPHLRERLWQTHFANGTKRSGIGLLVARAIVDSHGGRIQCVSNVPQGTCIEITLPATASTERQADGSRTYR